MRIRTESSSIATAVVAFLVLCALSLPAAVSAASFDERLEAALGLHEAATDLDQELAALAALEAVVETYPTEWRGHFWTAYVRTQIARLYKMAEGGEEARASSHLDRARSELDEARRLGEDAPPSAKSSFLALETLIHNFRGWFGQVERAAATAAARDSLVAAIREDPENPVVWVLIGTDLVSAGVRDEDPAQLVAGKIVLERARDAFASAAGSRGRTTHFNSEWLPFWIPRAENALAEIAGE